LRIEAKIYSFEDFIHLLERERVCTWGEGEAEGEGEGEKESPAESALSTEPNAELHPTTPRLRDHNLSQNQESVTQLTEPSRCPKAKIFLNKKKHERLHCQHICTSKNSKGSSLSCREIIWEGNLNFLGSNIKHQKWGIFVLIEDCIFLN